MSPVKIDMNFCFVDKQFEDLFKSIEKIICLEIVIKIIKQNTGVNVVQHK